MRNKVSLAAVYASSVVVTKEDKGVVEEDKDEDSLWDEKSKVLPWPPNNRIE